MSSPYPRTQGLPSISCTDMSDRTPSCYRFHCLDHFWVTSMSFVWSSILTSSSLQQQLESWVNVDCWHEHCSVKGLTASDLWECQSTPPPPSIVVHTSITDRGSLRHYHYWDQLTPSDAEFLGCWCISIEHMAQLNLAFLWVTHYSILCSPSQVDPKAMQVTEVHFAYCENQRRFSLWKSSSVLGIE